MKNPDIKYFIGSEPPRHTCSPIVGVDEKFRIITFRKFTILVKDVLFDEAQAFCKRHKIEPPTPNNQ